MGDRRGGMGDVKNKQPAPMQITAEQILREARERQEDENYTAPAQKITDPEVSLAEQEQLYICSALGSDRFGCPVRFVNCCIILFLSGASSLPPP